MARRKAKSKESPEIDVTIDRVKVNLDPDLNVYRVVITGNGGSWSHSSPSVDSLQEFLRGVRAGVSVTGGLLNEQEVPMFATFLAIPIKK